MRVAVITAILVAAVAATFAVGFVCGSIWQHRRLVAFELRADTLHYQTVQRGDIDSLRDQLGIALVARTRAYQDLFPEDRSSKTFTDAQRLTRDIRATADPRIMVPGTAK